MKLEIKNTFEDISALYKNILHWNISKIIIFIWSFILGIIFILPFALIFFIFTFFSGTNFSDFLNSWINGVYMTGIIDNFIYLLSIGSFTLGYFYSFILNINLNNGYLIGNKITYYKNEYFNYKLLLRYVLLTLYLLTIFLLPVIFFIFLLSVLVFVFGGIDNVTGLVLSNYTNSFSIASLILFILLLLTLYYLFYRFIFSYYLLFENDFKLEKLHNILKKSFSLTSGYKIFFKFFFINILIFSLYIPFSFISNYIKLNYNDLNSYSSYFYLKDEDKEQLKSLNPYSYEKLELKYSGKDLSNIEFLKKKFYVFSILFSVFKFLFINGVFIMFLTSFYNRNIYVKKS